MQEDKITQDIKIFQAVIKEAISQNPDAGINLVNIGQIQLNTGTNKSSGPNEIGEIEHKPFPTLQEGKGTVRLIGTDTKSLPRMPTEVHEDLKILMGKLPNPRFDSLIRLIFETSSKYCSSVQEAADWLGVTRVFMYGWYKKYGIPAKKRDREE